MRGESDALKYGELGGRGWRGKLQKWSVYVCVKAKCVWSAQVEKKKLMNEKYREAEEDAQREYKVHEY